MRKRAGKRKQWLAMVMAAVMTLTAAPEGLLAAENGSAEASVFSDSVEDGGFADGTSQEETAEEETENATENGAGTSSETDGTAGEDAGLNSGNSETAGEETTKSGVTEETTESDVLDTVLITEDNLADNAAVQEWLNEEETAAETEEADDAVTVLEEESVTTVETEAVTESQNLEESVVSGEEDAESILAGDGEETEADTAEDTESGDSEEDSSAVDYDFADEKSGILFKMNAEDDGCVTAVGLSEVAMWEISYYGLVVPETVENGGLEYTVTAIDSTFLMNFHDYGYSLSEIVIPDSVSSIETALFSVERTYSEEETAEETTENMDFESQGTESTYSEEETTEDTTEDMDFDGQGTEDSSSEAVASGKIYANKGSYAETYAKEKGYTAITDAIKLTVPDDIIVGEVVAPEIEFNLPGILSEKEDEALLSVDTECNMERINEKKFIFYNEGTAVLSAELSVLKASAEFEVKEGEPADFNLEDWEYTESDTYYSLNKYLGSAKVVYVPAAYEEKGIGVDGALFFANETLVSVTFAEGVKWEEIETECESEEDSALYNSIKAEAGGSYGSYEGLFMGCGNLTSVYCNWKDADIDSLTNTFVGCENILTVQNFPDAVQNMLHTFTGCSNLTSVSNLPDNVTYLYYTFSGCSSLTSVPEMSDGVTDLSATFKDCISLENVLTLPDSVEYMWSTFYGCSSLKNVSSLPNNVTNMSYTFYGCSNLESVPTLPDGVTNMIATFSGCESLTRVSNIPESVIDMAQTFYGCSNLESVPILPDSVTDMSDTFSGCSNLESVPNVPESVIDMTQTFFGCSSLKSVPDIPDGVTDMYFTFGKCSSLVSVTNLPESLTKMVGTFSNCSSLKSVPNIPDGVTKMGEILPTDGTFYNCKSLTSVPNIPENVTNMWYTFYGCSSLTDVPVLPDGITELQGTFAYCSSLKSIPNIPDSVVCMGEHGYSGGCDENSSYENTFGTFEGCSSLEEVPDLPDGVIIMCNTFSGCINLKSIPNIPSNVVDMERTFYGCVSLESVPNLPDSVTDMSYTFYNCSSLVSVPNLPDNVTDMSYTFYNCSSLVSVPNVPENVTDMTDTFYGCKSLKGYLDFYADPSVIVNVDDAFGGVGGAYWIDGYYEEDEYHEGYYSEYLFINYTLENESHINDICENNDNNIVKGWLIGSPTPTPTPNPSVTPTFEEGDTAEAPSSGFMVKVTDSQGQVISDASVKIEYVDSGSVSLTTDAEGTALDSETEAGSKGLRAVVSVEASGYRTRVTAHRLKQGTPYTVILTADDGSAYISGVILNSAYDLLNEEYPVYINEESTEEDSVKIYTGNFDSANTFQIIQNGTVVKESTEAGGSVTLTLKKDLAISGADEDTYKNCSVYACAMDDTMLVKEKLSLTLSGEAEEEFSGTVPIGTNFNFTVADDIPLLGSQTIEFDTKQGWAVYGTRDVDGTWRVYIGAKVTNDTKSLLPKDKKTFLEKIKNESQEELNKWLEKPRSLKALSWNGEVQFMGYGEGKTDPETGLTSVKLGIFMSIKIEGKRTWYRFFHCVPIYFTVKGSGEVDALDTGTVNFIKQKGKDGSLTFSGWDTNVTVNVTLTAGVGTGVDDVACIGVEGDGIVEWKPDFQNAGENLVTLQSKLRVKGVIGKLTFKQEWPSKTYQLYPQVTETADGDSSGSEDVSDGSSGDAAIAGTVASGLYDSGLYDTDSYEETAQTDFFDAEIQDSTLAQVDDGSALISGLYPNASPQVVTYNGKQYLFYINDLSGRTSSNRCALVYRVLADGVWSAETVVEDDGTADVGFSLSVEDDGIYVIWQDADCEFGEDLDYDTLVSHLGISMAKIGGEELQTLGQMTEVGKMPRKPTLIEDSGTQYLCWYENSENALAAEGTTSFYVKNLGTGETTLLAQTENYVSTASFAMWGGSLYAAWTEDTDGDLTTVSDKEILASCGNGTIRLTENETQDSAPKFTQYRGQEVLVWYSGGSLVYTDSVSGTAAELFDGDGLAVSEDYRLDASGDALTVTWQAAYTQGENAGQAILRRTYDGESWGTAVTAAQSADSIISYSTGIDADGNAWLAYTDSDLSDDSGATSLYVSAQEEIPQLAIAGAEYSENDYVPGEAFSITLTVENSGGSTVAGGSVQILQGEETLWTKTLDSLDAGGSSTVEITDFVPETSDEALTYQIQVLAGERVTAQTEFTLGNPDFSVEVDQYQMDGKELAAVTVRNCTQIPGTVTVTVTDPESGETVRSKTFENLAAQKTGSVTYSVESLFEGLDGTSLTVTAAAADGTEASVFDNTDYIYYNGNLKKLSNVKLTEETLELTEGESHTLTYEVVNGDPETLEWKSSKKSVATVDENGCITAVKEGTATISCYIDGKRAARCTVTVKGTVETPEDPDDPSVTPTAAPEDPSDPAVTPTAAPEDPSDPAVTPTAAPEDPSDPAVTPTAAPEDSSDPAVTPTTVPSDLAVTPTIAPASPTAAPSDTSGDAASNSTVSDTTAAQSCTHSWGAWEATREADVFTPEVQERTCSLCGEKETRESGTKLAPTIRVTATQIPLKVKQSTSKFVVSGLAAGDYVVSWKSSNVKVVKVSGKKDGTCKLTAGKKKGKATLTITLASGLTKKVTVKVQKGIVKTKKITAAGVSGKTLVLKKGQSLTLDIALTPFTSVQKVTCTSSNKKVVTVTSKGKLKAKAAGKATITVKSGSKKLKIKVTVKK